MAQERELQRIDKGKSRPHKRRTNSGISTARSASKILGSIPEDDEQFHAFLDMSLDDSELP